MGVMRGVYPSLYRERLRAEAMEMYSVNNISAITAKQACGYLLSLNQR